MIKILTNCAKMELLKELLCIPSVSGDESKMTIFLENYVYERRGKWKVAPEIFHGENFHDCLMLKFGNPRTAVIAHMDTVGFMARYENQFVTIGGPEICEGTKVVGEDEFGPIICGIEEKNGHLFHDFGRAISPGTCFSFLQDIKVNDEFIQAAYLDNRLGIYNCLQICEELEDGWVVFSTYEEHGGGSIPFLLKFIQDTAPIKQALISDITWVTDGIKHHEGVVISIRDKYIPRKAFLDKIIKMAIESKIPFQIEVEGIGSSDGREVQFSPYMIDWCFIGAPEDNVHTPFEIVSLLDLEAMIRIYRYLLARL